MRIVHSIADLRKALENSRQTAFVPTMGNLHDGHVSLVRRAASLGQPVVASIFVNRLQFAPHEDFDRYPRTLAGDCERLAAAGCELLFAPEEAELYPEPQTYRVLPPPSLADTLEGQFRPGFFVGVCTVVLKLFNAVAPRIAVFGKKDYQQLLVIRGMVRQCGLPIEIEGAATVREADGLAMSSRNGYLTAAERVEAAELHRQLQHVVTAVRAGDTNWSELETSAREALELRGWSADYVAIRRRSDLAEPAADGSLIVLAAARLGSTRLIDNLEI